MHRYIFFRDYNKDGIDIKKGSILTQETRLTPKKKKERITVKVYDDRYKEMKIKVDTINGLAASMMELNGDLFINAYKGAAFHSWINEKASDRKNDNETLLYPFIRKSPETLIMFLRDSGLTNFQIMQQMFGEENKYHNFLDVARKEEREFLLSNTF